MSLNEAGPIHVRQISHTMWAIYKIPRSRGRMEDPNDSTELHDRAHVCQCERSNSTVATDYIFWYQHTTDSEMTVWVTACLGFFLLANMM